MKKVIAMLLAVVLIIGATVAGTLAWLTDETGPIENTFTVGDITIDLGESFNTDTDGKDGNDAWYGTVIPGCNLTKNPWVTVESNSEKCWLFVALTEENWPDCTSDGAREVDWHIADGWTELENVPGVDENTRVFYRTNPVEKSTEKQTFQVLENDQVTVSENLTKQEVNNIGGPFKLTIKAYACQCFKNKSAEFTPAEAWSKVQN